MRVLYYKYTTSTFCFCWLLVSILLYFIHLHTHSYIKVHFLCKFFLFVQHQVYSGNKKIAPHLNVFVFVLSTTSPISHTFYVLYRKRNIHFTYKHKHTFDKRTFFGNYFCTKYQTIAQNMHNLFLSSTL